MKTTQTVVKVNPMTRIEGHLDIEAVIDNKKVVEAKSKGTLYRGFEQILLGRNPVDAVQLTQRFCGVCLTPHAIASSQEPDNAFGVMQPNNGRIIRNIMQGLNYIQSHVLHFYHIWPHWIIFVDRICLLLYQDMNRTIEFQKQSVKSWSNIIS